MHENRKGETMRNQWNWNRIGTWAVIVLAWMAASGGTALAGVSLGAPFGNDMVLQRDLAVPVWGWADPDAKVEVEFKGQKKEATAGKDGKWRVMLDPLKTDPVPAVLTVRSPNGNAEVRNVLVGEVWICSGQSNMAMPLKDVLDAQAHIATADLPKLRVLSLPVAASGLPRERTSAAVSWQICSQQTAGSFSAVAFFFGRDLLRALDVPVGLVVVATGATPIEQWIPREGLDGTPELAGLAAEARKIDDEHRAALATGTVPPHPYAGPVGQKIGELVKNRNRGLGALFNGSVAPVAGYALRGMIWYQGESNRGDMSTDYFNLHKALVIGWRKVWNEGDFPFYYVQISAHESWRPGWHVPEVWEGQARILALPNTGMAVIHDLCEDIKNIHPKNKEGVGQRLALLALARTYGKTDAACSGPIYKSHEAEGNRIRIRFDFAKGGLRTRDDKPIDWFEVAGADGKFLPAQATAENDTVTIWNDQVPQPVNARFAWDGKAQPNLVNGAGLPAAPFRTDGPR